MYVKPNTEARSQTTVAVEKQYVQGGSNMTRTNCDLFTHKSSRSYLNHLVLHIFFSTYECAWVLAQM
jgi:hypothetical protein